MSPLWMRWTTFIFFLFMIIHAWIGVQHVIDDYIKLINHILIIGDLMLKNYNNLAKETL